MAPYWLIIYSASVVHCPGPVADRYGCLDLTICRCGPVYRIWGNLGNLRLQVTFECLELDSLIVEQLVLIDTLLFGTRQGRLFELVRKKWF